MTIISDFQQKARQLVPEQKEFLIQKIQTISKEHRLRPRSPNIGPSTEPL